MDQLNGKAGQGGPPKCRSWLGSGRDWLVGRLLRTHPSQMLAGKDAGDCRMKAEPSELRKTRSRLLSKMKGGLNGRDVNAVSVCREANYSTHPGQVAA